MEGYLLILSCEDLEFTLGECSERTQWSFSLY